MAFLSPKEFLSLLRDVKPPEDQEHFAREWAQAIGDDGRRQGKREGMAEAEYQRGRASGALEAIKAFAKGSRKKES